MLHSMPCKHMDFTQSPPVPGDVCIPVFRKPEMKILLILNAVWRVKEILCFFLGYLVSPQKEPKKESFQRGFHAPFLPWWFFWISWTQQGVGMWSRGADFQDPWDCPCSALSQHRGCYGATLEPVAFPILLTTSVRVLHDSRHQLPGFPFVYIFKQVYSLTEERRKKNDSWLHM